MREAPLCHSVWFVGLHLKSLFLHSSVDTDFRFLASVRWLLISSKPRGMFPFTIATWCTQRISSLGLVSLFSLLYLALWHSRRHGDPNETSNSQLALAYYAVLVHVLALAFPLRLCYATWRLTKSLRESTRSRDHKTASLAHFVNRPKLPRVPSSSEISSYASSSSDITTSDSESSASSYGDEESVIHAIIIPNYKEDLNTLRETLEVLACHPQASSTYEVSCLSSAHTQTKPKFHHGFG
jgi:hypothetical protein